jgi:hypothetical protein
MSPLFARAMGFTEHNVRSFNKGTLAFLNIIVNNAKKLDLYTNFFQVNFDLAYFASNNLQKRSVATMII